MVKLSLLSWYILSRACSYPRFVTTGSVCRNGIFKRVVTVVLPLWLHGLVYHGYFMESNTLVSSIASSKDGVSSSGVL